MAERERSLLLLSDLNLTGTSSGGGSGNDTRLLLYFAYKSQGGAIVIVPLLGNLKKRGKVKEMMTTTVACKTLNKEREETNHFKEVFLELGDTRKRLHLEGSTCTIRETSLTGGTF